MLADGLIVVLGAQLLGQGLDARCHILPFGRLGLDLLQGRLQLRAERLKEVKSLEFASLLPLLELCIESGSLVPVPRFRALTPIPLGWRLVPLASWPLPFAFSRCRFGTPDPLQGARWSSESKSSEAVEPKARLIRLLLPVLRRRRWLTSGSSVAGSWDILRLLRRCRLSTGDRTAAGIGFGTRTRRLPRLALLRAFLCRWLLPHE